MYNVVSVAPCMVQAKRAAKESTPSIFIVVIIIPLAPLPVRGFMKAVGKALINCGSIPKKSHKYLNAEKIISKAPEVSKTPTPTRMATRYGIILTLFQNHL